MSTCMCTPISI
uniref:Uncharacterized protein n=1 Tax=Anguilla anguilla TaxID=7936 RepID=A0A0E9VSM2_ANGAN